MNNNVHVRDSSDGFVFYTQELFRWPTTTCMSSRRRRHDRIYVVSAWAQRRHCRYDTCAGTRVTNRKRAFCPPQKPQRAIYRLPFTLLATDANVRKRIGARARFGIRGYVTVSSNRSSATKITTNSSDFQRDRFFFCFRKRTSLLIIRFIRVIITNKLRGGKKTPEDVIKSK